MKPRTFAGPSVTLAAFAGLALSLTTAHAAPVAVTNASFETGDPPAGWGPDGWTRDGGTAAGRYDAATSGQSGTDGSYWLWVNPGVTVYQDTGEVIVEGTTYTLTVDVGGAFWSGQSATIRLYGSTVGLGTALGGAEASVVVAAATWEQDQTVSFTATATEAGQTLGIALTATSPQAVFDNVRLDAGVGDSLPPSLTGKVPGNGDSHVEVGANLVATFNENVQKGTGNIVIKKYDDDMVVETIDVTTGNVSISGADVTINPVSDLPDDTQVYVEIAAGAIEDLAGNDFAGISGNADWTFTTDATAPSYTTLSPVNGDSGVPSGTNLVITLDEDVQEGTGNVVIKESGGSVFETIPFGVSDARISISGGEVTIDPTGSLAFSAGYYVEIDNGAIKDLANLDFAGFMGSSTWSFTTGAPGLINPSFDDDGTITSVTPTGWTSVNASLGTRPGVSGVLPTDGTHELWLNGGNTIYQNSGIIIELGETYTLTVDVTTTPPFDGHTGTLRLYGSTLGFGTAIGGAETSKVTAQSVWTTETVSFTATAVEAGQTLGVALSTTGTQTEWDYVRLVIGAVGGGNDFTDWIGLFPGVGGQTGFGDDPDGDQLDSGIEAFFGTDPSASNAGLTQVSQSGALFTFQHPEADPQLDDVTGSYEWSLDLLTWNPSGTVGNTTVTISASQNDPSPGTTTVSADTTGSTITPTQLFLRVVASN